MPRGKITISAVVFPLAVFLLLAATCVEAAQKEVQPVEPVPAAEAEKPEIEETEIVGFYLHGRYPWEELNILDLDVILPDSGIRMIPLKNLLRRMEVKYTESQGRLIFTPHGGKEVEIGGSGRLVLIAGDAVRAEYVKAVSDFTLEEDYFFDAETIAKLLGFKQIDWNDVEYAFEAETEKSLPMWKIEEGVSLFSIDTEEIKVPLPELFPHAKPEKRMASLDFVEVRASGRVRAIDESAGDATLSGLEQTYWGSFMNGRYKVRVAEDTQRFTDGKLEESGNPFFTVPHAEWKYAFDSADLLVGDTSFGLNDLVFPSLRLTGVRMNGIGGETGGGGESEYGLRHRFLRPLVFEGFARVGSVVELFINNRLVESEEVLVDLPGQPGTGRYRFEDVSLAPGSVNEIRIRITDPDGVVTVIEEDVLGSSLLLPKGSVAYLGGLGTNRDTSEWESQGIIGGGRVFYGITDSVTVGLTAAAQEDYFIRRSLFDKEDRDNPESSRHFGAQIAVQPIDMMIVEGDVGWVNFDGRENESGEGGEDTDDLAYFLKSSIHPVKQLSFEGFYFLYGPDYFNGSNIELTDREGYVANSRYRPVKDLKFMAAYTKVEDNVEGNNETTMQATAYHLEAGTTWIPNTEVILSRDLLDPDWEEDEKVIDTIAIRTRPLRRLNVYASHSEGEDFTLETNSDFFNGLRLPGIPIRATRNTEVGASFQAWTSASITGRYRRSESTEQASLIFSANKFLDSDLQTRSELGWNYDTEMMFFSHRTEYRLPSLGDTRIGFQTEFRNEEWSGAFFVAIDEVFNMTGDGVKHVKNRYIKPDSGMIMGRVFVDADADGILDSGEPGIEDIEVVLNRVKKESTDEDGYFMFPAGSPEYAHRLRVNIESVPATLICTHCTQGAYCGRGSQNTVVNFGLAPANSISGVVRVAGNSHIEFAPGVRILAKGPDGEIKADSITAQDGSFYLGNLLPGTYTLVMEESTILPIYRTGRMRQEVEIPSTVEWQDIKADDFVLTYISE